MHLSAVAAMVVALPGLLEAHAAPQRLPAEFSDVRWHVGSTVFGDFTCRGRQDMAIFGVSEKSGFVVVVHPNGKTGKPSYASFATRGRDPLNMRLTVESLELSTDEASKGEQEYLPPDLTPSKTCKGLALGDGETDSHHIYWSRSKRALRSWSL